MQAMAVNLFGLMIHTFALFKFVYRPYVINV